MSTLHTVLGATGGAGRAIAEELIRQGKRVRTVNRSGSPLPGAEETLAADIETADGAAEAVAGSDVVYLAAQPPYDEWQGRFPAMLDNVIDAVERDGAKLVMVDNLYMYGPGSSAMAEDTPMRAGDKKGRVRIEMVEMLDAAIDRGVRVTSGRASDYFGSGSGNSAVTALAIEPALERKAPRWMGRTDVAHSLAYLPDVARAYVALGTHERAHGHHWVLPHVATVTGAEFLDLITTAAGLPASKGRISKPMLMMAAPFHTISRESLGVYYQWDQPFVADSSRFESAFGPFESTPLAEAVAQTLGVGHRVA
ncbi:MAG: NAD-dependent epimerase/dehydratase family protein [Acidimicrobiia bacterium]|nr:NAD-dependent epimerase/dehydratase family protein [Acidimicrobiia bacterium]